MFDVSDLLSTTARTARPSPIRSLLRLVDQPGILSLAGGLPAAEAIPQVRIEAAVARVLARPGRYGPLALQYGPTEGIDDLRRLVAERLLIPGVEPEDVVVTTGSQQALDLLGRVLLDPGDTVVVEAPSYLGALQAMMRPGVRFVAVPMDEAGLRVDVLAERLVAGLRPKLVYTVPTFHNPTGAVLAVDRRRALAALADRFGFVVVEDDPYAELRFAGDPVRPIGAFGDRVVTLGSASKIIAPGLRVGWARVPPALAPIRDAMVVGKQAADLHTSSLGQLLVADLLADRAAMASQLAHSRAAYARRARALAEALRAEGDDLVTFADPAGGMFLWLTLRAEPAMSTSAESLLVRALEAGVAFVPGAAFALDPAAPTPTLRCSFASLDEDGLAEAAARLAAAIRRSEPNRVGRAAAVPAGA